jgi:predicted permease
MSLISPSFRSDWETTWNAQWLSLVGRVRPGVTREEAQDDATAAHRRIAADGPPILAQARIGMAPITHTRSGGEPLELAVSRWLLGVSVIVLMIACANVAALLLARGARRGREVAVRLALGVRRRRLISMLLIEGVLLSLCGAACALLFAHVTGTLVRTVLLPDVEWLSPPVDTRVLLFTLMVAVLVGVLSALLPAFRTSGLTLTSAIRTGVRDGGGRTSILQRSLTVLQAALSVILLVGAGLFVRSLLNVQGLDLGIEPARVLAVDVYQPDLPPPDEPEARAAERERRSVRLEQALAGLRALPSVEHAGLAIGTPFHSSFTVDLRVSGHDSIPALEGGGPYVAAVTAGYFETVGTSVLQGRAFTHADRRGSEPVAIVNQTMATMLWPDRSPLGECVHVGSPAVTADTPCSRIVGVVEDARRYGIREPPAMQYYIPAGQESGFGGSMLLVRPRAGSLLSFDDVRSHLYRMDPAVRWVEVATLQQELDPQLRPWRLGATLFAAFGALALLIAGIGLYSVIAYAVANRSHELCVRLALGAHAGNLLRMVLLQGTALALVGVVAGVLVAFAASRYLEHVLFEASPRDPLVFGAVAATLLVTALCASLVPALRAASVQPVTALRGE